jgi:hypothetical protein
MLATVEFLLDLPYNRTFSATPSAQQTDHVNRVASRDCRRNGVGNSRVRSELVFIRRMIGEEFNR